MDDVGHRWGVARLLCGAVRNGTTDWTEAWGACGRYAELGTEEHGVCDMDGVHVPEPRDSIGWWVLFVVAQSGELLAIVEGENG